MKEKIIQGIKVVNFILAAVLIGAACCLFTLAALRRPSAFGYTAFVANDQNVPIFFIVSKHAADMQSGKELLLEVDGRICAVRIVQTSGNAIYYLDDTQTLTGIYMDASQCIGVIVFENVPVGEFIQMLRRPQMKRVLIAGGTGLFLICGSLLVFMSVRSHRMRRRAYYDALLEEFLYPNRIKEDESEEISDEVFEIKDPIVTETQESEQAEEGTREPKEEEGREEKTVAVPDEQQEESLIRWELVESAQLDDAPSTIIREEWIQPEEERLVMEEKTCPPAVEPPNE